VWGEWKICLQSEPSLKRVLRSYFTTDSQSVCLSIEHPRGTCNQIVLPVGVSKLLYDWRSVSQYVLGVGHPFGAHDQIFLFPFFCRTVALLFVQGHPLWREDGSVTCSAICRWSESRRTHNHTLLSLLGSLPVASHDSQGLRWKYSYPLWREDGSAVCSAICRWSEPRKTHNQTLLPLLGSLPVASYDSQGLRGKYSTLSDERTGLQCVVQSVGGESRGGLVTIHYWLYWVPFPSPLTTRRDYGGSILTRLQTG
jgi:hypothetical protein